MAHKNLKFFEELHDEKSSKVVHNFFSVGITCVTVWNSVFCSSIHFSGLAALMSADIARNL